MVWSSLRLRICGELAGFNRYCLSAICSRPCENGGKCAEPESCQCPNGYSGVYCQDKVAKIAPSPSDTNTVRSYQGPKHTSCEYCLFATQVMKFMAAGTLDSETEGAICVSANGAHYKSFDDREFSFAGKCIYNLAFECGGLFHIQVSSS